MLRFLLVDSQHLVRLGLESLLGARFGSVAVGEATTFREARSLLAREQWDLVLLEIALPGRSGMGLLAEARRSPHPPPVVVLSSHRSMDYGVEAMRRGAATYLPKTASGAEVMEAVSEALAGRQYIVSELASSIAQSIANPVCPNLTGRESQVLRLLADGWNLGQIARSLGLTEKTVSRCRARLYSKLSVDSVAGLVRHTMLHSAS